MRVRHLQVNHLTAPIGIDGSKVRLSWNVEDGVKQTAFRVTVIDQRGALLEDSGKIRGDRMFYTLSAPIPFRSTVHASVSVWDENDKPSEECRVKIMTGIEKSAWKACWINPELDTDPKAQKRGSYLRKSFQIEKGLTDKSAFLYFTAHGICNVYLNGQEITDHQLMPGTSQVSKRLMVETVEVSSFLQGGENEIIVTLGDGWYRGSMADAHAKNVYGTDVAFLAQLEIDQMPVLITDASWEASQSGPLGLNDLMDGEEYDATRERLTGFHAVKLENFGFDNLICRDTVPVVPKETFPARLITTPAGETLLDFGQNLVGYVRLRFVGEAGRKLILTHGEVLDKNGNFTVQNFQSPKVPTKQQVSYICKDGLNDYHPTKTYMGFRYVKVEADFEIKPEYFTAVAIYSDMRETAAFTCGVEAVNQLFRNAMWSMKGNFVDVPTDCPTREKSGYSGDAQAFVSTATYLMDCYPVYAKWIAEQAATQFEDGCVAQIAPSPSLTKTMSDGGIGWSDSIEIVPYHLLQRYGDETIVADHYETIKKWMLYEISRAKKTRLHNKFLLPKSLRQHMIDTGWMWGEWLEPGTNVVPYMMKLLLSGDPEVGTAYLYYGCFIASQMAERLGKTEDAAFFLKNADKAKEAYRAMFVKNGKIREKKRQCRYVRPIFMGLLSEEEKKSAAADLARLVEKSGGHLNTGFLSTNDLCRVLSDYGQEKTAYDLLLQEDCPGWLYAVNKGCTTIPESWECFDKNGNPYGSFNHYSYGAIAGWLIDSVCGIRCEDGRIRVAPKPDKRLGFADATYDSPLGRIRSGWKYEDGRFRYTVEIPANQTATICIPRSKPLEVSAGTYEFVS